MKAKLKKWQWIILAGLIVLTAGSHFAIQRISSRILTKYKDETIAKIQDKYDIEFHYGSISPAFLGVISIDDLEIKSRNPQKAYRIYGEKVRLYYNPFLLIENNALSLDAASVFRRIVIINGDIQIPIQKIKEEQSNIALNFPDLPELVFLLRNTKLTLFNDDISLETDLIRASAYPLDDYLELNLRISETLTFLSDNPVNITEIQANSDIQGYLGYDLSYFDIKMSFSDIESDYFALSEQNFSLKYFDNGLEIRKIEDDLPLDIILYHQFSSNETTLNWDSEQFSPVMMIEQMDLQSGRWAPWLNTVVSGTGTLVFENQLLKSYSFDGEFQVNNPRVPFPFLIKTDVTGDPQVIDFQSISFISDYGSINYQGIISIIDWVPEGDLVLDNIYTPFNYTVDSTITLGRKDNLIYLSSLNIEAGSVNINDFQVLMGISKDKTVSGSLLASIASESNGADQIIFTDFLLDLNSKALNCYWDIDNLNLVTVSQLVQMGRQSTDFLRPYYLNTNGTLRWTNQRFAMQVEDLTCLSSAEDDFSIALSMVYDGVDFSVPDIVIQKNGIRSSAYLNGERNSTLFQGSAGYRFMGEFFDYEFIYQPGKYFTLSGSDATHILSRFENDRVFIEGQVNDIPLYTEKGRIVCGVDFNGYFKEKTGLELNLSQFTINPEYPFLDSETLIKGAGYITNSSFQINTFQIMDTRNVLFGNGFVSWTDLKNKEGQVWLQARNNKNSENFSLILSHNRNGDLNGEFQANRLALDRLRGFGLSGTIDASVALSGNNQYPVFSGYFQSRDMNYQEIPIDLNGEAEYRQSILTAENLNINIGDILFDNGFLQYNQNDQSFTFSSPLNIQYIDSQFQTDITAVGHINRNEAKNIITDSSLLVNDIYRIGVNNNDWEMFMPRQFYSIAMTETNWEIINKNPNTLQLQYDLRDGNLSGVVGNPFPLNTIISGTIEDGQGNIELSDFEFDLSALNYIIPKDPYLRDNYVVFKDGTLSGSLVLKGPLRNPDMYGELKASDVLVDTPYTQMPTDYTDFNISFYENLVYSDNIAIPMSGGILTCNAMFLFSRWVPSSFSLDIEALPVKENLGVHFAYPVKNVYFNGLFQGNVQVLANDKGVDVNGDILFNKLDVTLGEELEKAPYRTNPYPKKTIVDIRFVTGRNVQFFLPNKKLQIVEVLSASGEEVHIQYDNISQVSSFIGEFNLKSGNINYFGQKFYLTEGNIVFDENQNKFNPYISLSADIKSRDSDGENITITLLYEGLLMDNLEPRFLSSGGDTESEILTYLGQSLMTKDDGITSEREMPFIMASDFIFNPTLIQPLEDVFQESIGLDIISFQTRIIENTILDRVFYNEYYQDESYEFTIGRYLDNTSVFFGKYLGDYLFLSGSFLFKYTNDQNEESILRDMNLKMLLNVGLEMETPLFTIGWNYSPGLSDEHFVADNSVTIKWKWTF